MSCLGLWDNRWQLNTGAGLGKIPNGVSASRAGAEWLLVHLITGMSVIKGCSDNSGIET